MVKKQTKDYEEEILCTIYHCNRSSVGTRFLMDSAHGASHEGFSESTNPPPHIDDGTDDDSPF